MPTLKQRLETLERDHEALKKDYRGMRDFVLQHIMDSTAGYAFNVGMDRSFHAALVAVLQTHPDKVALSAKMGPLLAAASADALFHTSEPQLQGALAAEELIQHSIG